jgi:hypothetical protein
VTGSPLRTGNDVSWQPVDLNDLNAAVRIHTVRLPRRTSRRHEELLGSNVWQPWVNHGGVSRNGRRLWGRPEQRYACRDPQTGGDDPVQEAARNCRSHACSMHRLRLGDGDRQPANRR